jgi:glycosyltransferase involved in cell wall biosynthesis
VKRLAIITTHPIQYYAPIFRILDQRGNIAVKVFYTWEKDASLFDKDFGKEIKWDIPLLEGYDHHFVSNSGNYGRGFRSIRNPTLIPEIEDWAADAVLFFGWNYHSHLRAMRYFSGKIPVLFRGDSTLLNERPGLKRIARRLFLRWVYRHVDTALYVGLNNKDYFLAHGLKEEQLVFAPHAIDNDRFSDKDGKYEQEARRWKKELGIGEQDHIITFVGKLQDTKDPFLLLEAFRTFGHPGWHLVYIGNGELESQLKEAAGKNKNIHFLSFQNQSRMPVVYRLGDIFCLPSKGETWGLAVNEAMACGRAVLLSDKCGCTADLLVEDRNGFAFASGNKADLVDKMTKLTAPDRDIRSMGLFSAELIRSWSYDQVAPAIERCLLNDTIETK